MLSCLCKGHFKGVDSDILIGRLNIMSQSYPRLKELMHLVIIPKFDLRLWLDLDWMPRCAFDCLNGAVDHLPFTFSQI